MLTAIYVFEPSTLRITSANRNERAVLRAYPETEARSDRPALGELPLAPGIYAILSFGPLLVERLSGRYEQVALQKDEWPDPPAIPEGPTREQLRAYFAEIAKGGDV